jgi:hypothetical protein
MDEKVKEIEIWLDKRQKLLMDRQLPMRIEETMIQYLLSLLSEREKRIEELEEGIEKHKLKSYCQPIDFIYKPEELYKLIKK